MTDKQAVNLKHACNLQAAVKATPKQPPTSIVHQQQQQQHTGQDNAGSGSQIAARQSSGRSGAQDAVKQTMAQQCLAKLPWAQQALPQRPLARQPAAPQCMPFPAQQAAATSSSHAQALAMLAGSSLGSMQVC